MITQKLLKELLNYDPDTGIFTWIIRRSQSVKSGSIAGGVESLGYRRITISKKRYAAHRLAFLYMVGRFPTEIDHINHKRDDDRWCNLREVTKSENHHNESLAKNNTSGVIGVREVNRRSKWRASITVNGKKIELGSYLRFNDAVAARKEAEMEHGFHPNHGSSHQPEQAQYL